MPPSTKTPKRTLPQLYQDANGDIQILATPAPDHSPDIAGHPGQVDPGQLRTVYGPVKSANPQRRKESAAATQARHEQWARLRFQEGWSNRKVATWAGVNENTVSKAMQKLGLSTYQPAPHTAQYAQRWADLFVQEGFTASQIARQYGTDPSKVGRVLRSLGLGNEIEQHQRAHHRARSAAARERLEQRLYHQVLAAMANAVPCCVCGDWVLRYAARGAHKTCSPECTRIWGVARHRLDATEGEKGRQASARYVLRHPDRYRALEIARATRVLSDPPSVPTRRWAATTSKASAVMEALARGDINAAANAAGAG